MHVVDTLSQFDVNRLPINVTIRYDILHLVILDIYDVPFCMTMGFVFIYNIKMGLILHYCSVQCCKMLCCQLINIHVILVITNYT